MKLQKYVTITKKTYEDIRRLFVLAYPCEACGLVIGHRETYTAQAVFNLRNSALKENRKSCFEIDPLEIYKAESLADQMGMEVIGILHSHPDKPAITSNEDEKNMIPGMLYLIGTATEKEMADLRVYNRAKPEGKVYEMNLLKE